MRSEVHRHVRNVTLSDPEPSSSGGFWGGTVMAFRVVSYCLRNPTNTCDTENSSAVLRTLWSVRYCFVSYHTYPGVCASAIAVVI